MGSEAAPPAPALFTPLTIRGLRLRNRVVLSPMCQYAAVDGYVQDWHYIHHAKFAMAGIAVGFVEATAVSAVGRITHGCTGLWEDGQVQGLARIAALYESFGAVPAIQLSHAGWKGSAQRPADGGGGIATGAAEPPWQTVGPSPMPCREGWPPPRALDHGGIEAIKEEWRLAFRRALTAGFKIVEIHGAHGYLIHSFLSPISNGRKDAYGGDREGRMRLALEIAAIGRSEWPPSLPVFFRISAVDDVEGGWTLEDSVALAKALRERGIDVIDCSSGGLQSVPPSGRLPLPQGFQVPMADVIRREASIATMAVGLIVDPDFANEVVADGAADLVAIAREFLADPNWVYRAAQALDHTDALALLPRSYSLYLARRGIVRRTSSTLAVSE